MSGVYIPGMQMPKSCVDCILSNKFFGQLGCNKLDLDEYLHNETRHPDCPLISVPDHGRLIDADALYRQIKTECNPYGKPTIGFDDGLKVLGIIGRTPLIIAADKEGEA